MALNLQNKEKVHSDIWHTSNTLESDDDFGVLMSWQDSVTWFNEQRFGF